MSLVELIAQADERGLAASGLACLDRCLPLLGGDDEILRPLWAGLADEVDADDWSERLEQVRGRLGPALASPAVTTLGGEAAGRWFGGGGSGPVGRAFVGGERGGGKPGGRESGGGEPVDGQAVDGEAVLLARRMLAATPSAPGATEVRLWADACSVAALRIHRLLEGAAPEDADAASVGARREGRTEGMSPLVAAELRRQVAVLELLSEHGAGGLRRALEVSTEGRRVLRAVVSRRTRGKRG
ncbi:hypothetical protein OG604_28710 [Streptomyces sp. NBC_01231]|nr:hypothetical protein OG604_28710 [Streptomyces sp. NBC_01231]